MQKRISFLAIVFIGLAACSSSAQPAAKATTTASSATTAPASSDTPESFSLTEWAIAGSKSVGAGSHSIKVTNDGNFKHSFHIARGDSYKALPLDATGAVDEGKLSAADKIAAVDGIGAGESKTLDVNLPAGRYVLYCNISVGSVSHASKGQVLEISVG